MKGQLEDTFDVHAGAFETANMKEIYPELTSTERAEQAKATMLKGEQIEKWLAGESSDNHASCCRIMHLTCQNIVS